MGIAGDTGLGGTQHPCLLVEQEAFALETTGVTGELAAATDDAMARHDDAERVAGIGRSDRPYRSGPAEGECNLRVGARGAVLDRHQRLHTSRWNGVP